MRVRKLLAFVLALLLVASLAACGGGGASTAAPPAGGSASAATSGDTGGDAPAGEGEYVDGLFHYNETQNFTARQRFETQYVSDPNTEVWFYRWVEDAFNIHFEVEGVPHDVAEDQSSLMFASNDLPEVLFNWPLSNINDQARYGDQDGQLVNLDDYFTEDYAPNLMKVFEGLPSFRASLTTNDGSIFGFPSISQNTETLINQNFQPLWYDPETLSAVGWDEPPATLEELLEVLRAIKTQDPRGQGANNIPLGGSDSTGSLLGGVLWNALGVIEDFRALQALKGGGMDSGGELIPFRTDDTYRVGLEYMNTLYSEGLIDPDFYTLTTPETVAKLSNGQTGLMTFYDVYDLPADQWQRWRTMPPLTSAVNDTPIVKYAGPGSGNFYCYITSECSNPGAIVRMCDPAYSQEHKMKYFYGPEVDSGTEMYGLTEGWYYDEFHTPQFPEIVSGKYTQINQVTYRATPFAYSGNVWDRRTDGSEFEFYSRETEIGLRALEDVDVLNKYLPYGRKLPPIPQPLDKVELMADLQKQLTDYSNAETAKFIVGDRPLTDDEWNAYVQEMNDLGYEEYMGNVRSQYEARYSEFFNTVTRPDDL